MSSLQSMRGNLGRIGRSRNRDAAVALAAAIATSGVASVADGIIMRAETEKLVEDIKRSVGLLRRHL